MSETQTLTGERADLLESLARTATSCGTRPVT